MRKEDFGEINHHGGVSPAWPIRYEDMEPYYTEAEQLYHVHGNQGEDPTEPKRSRSYLHPAPKDGRPTPADTRANDLWHWQTVLSTASVATAAQKIRSGRGRIVSPGPVAIPEKGLGFTKGFLVRDADGHGLQLIEK